MTDPEIMRRARQARDQLIARFIHHPAVTLIGIGRAPAKETVSETGGLCSRSMFVRIGLDAIRTNRCPSRLRWMVSRCGWCPANTSWRPRRTLTGPARSDPAGVL